MLYPWFVVTPEYEYVEYEECWPVQKYTVTDYVWVEAPTARSAISQGVKIMLQGSPFDYPWVHERRGDKLCPYTGVKANLSKCEHGVIYWEDHTDVCDLCYREFHGLSEEINSKCYKDKNG